MRCIAFAWPERESLVSLRVGTSSIPLALSVLFDPFKLVTPERGERSVHILPSLTTRISWFALFHRLFSPPAFWDRRAHFYYGFGREKDTHGHLAALPLVANLSSGQIGDGSSHSRGEIGSKKHSGVHQFP
jgi:hypothetical protein